ncbi:MAG: VTT domain-containing protein [Bryobacteraceae bacterium]
MSKVVAWLQGWGPAGAVGLAVLDSAGVPLPAGVDIMLLLVAASNRSMAMLTAVLAVVGSAMGSFILFSIARKGGQVYLEKHTHSQRAKRFREWFERYGLITVFIPALVPIPLPLKVFVLSAGALGVSPVKFVSTIVAARMPRYLGLAWLGSELGEHSLPWLNAHKWQMAAAAFLIGVALAAAVRHLGRGQA